MKIGIVFPQTEFGSTNPLALRDYAQAIEELGFTHLLAYDHILGGTLTGPAGGLAPTLTNTPLSNHSCFSLIWLPSPLGWNSSPALSSSPNARLPSSPSGPPRWICSATDTSV